jgi:hypothetical protein
MSVCDFCVDIQSKKPDLEKARLEADINSHFVKVTDMLQETKRACFANEVVCIQIRTWTR